MQTESMELGEFLESARKIRIEKDADRQYWLVKGETQKADECHDGAKRRLKLIQAQQDPVSFSFLYPYIELKVRTLRRDWLEDIESLCTANPNWKNLTWDAIRREVLRHDRKIQSELKIKEEEKKADASRMEKYGTPTIEEKAENEEERMQLSDSWDGSGGDPAIFGSRLWGPLPQSTRGFRPESSGTPDPVLDPNRPNVLSRSEVDPRPNRPNVLSGNEQKTPLSQINPITESGKFAFAYVKWAVSLPDEQMIDIFGKRGCGKLSDHALGKFIAYAKSKGLSKELNMNSRTEAKIRKGLKQNADLEVWIDEIMKKAARLATE